MHPVDDSTFIESSAPVGAARRLLLENGLGCVAVLDADGMVVGSLGLDDLSERPQR